MEAAPRLTCQQCKKRKRKCDKGAPCSACRSAGLKCTVVERARLPRGKSGQMQSRDALLESHVARIESLLMQKSRIEMCPTPRAEEHAPKEPRVARDGNHEENSSKPSNDNYGPHDFVASGFWTALSDEIIGMREILASPIEEAQEPLQTDTQSQPSWEMSEAGPSAVLFGHTAGDLSPTSLSQRARILLLDLYRSRVENVQKVLHWPTTMVRIEAARAEDYHGVGNLHLRALEAAIYFMALCSVTDDEARTMDLGDRSELVRQHRSTVEALLSQSRLMTQPDIIIMQAFIIYLTGLRTCLTEGRAWSLVSIAVRAAIALRLGDEDPEQFSPFELQLRRRVLFAIGLLDTHASLDRGTPPIMPSTAFDTMPLNINDSDMTPESVPTQSSKGMTDMSFSLMVYQAVVCQRKLCEVPHSNPNDTTAQWSKKLALVAELHKTMQCAYACVTSSSPAIDQFLKLSAEKIMTGVQLELRRPPYRQRRNAVPDWDDFDVMRSATKVLEDHLQEGMPALFAPWGWKRWVQWPSLAMVLAELCCSRPGGGDDGDDDHAFDVAARYYASVSRSVADGESGMLWKPITRLMRRVEQVRRRSPATAAEEMTPAQPRGSDDAAMGGNGNGAAATSLFDRGTTSLGVGDVWAAGAEGQTWDVLTGSTVDPMAPWMSWDLFIGDVNSTAGDFTFDTLS